MKFEIIIHDSMTRIQIRQLIESFNSFGLSASVTNELDVISVWGFRNGSELSSINLTNILELLDYNNINTGSVSLISKK